jgi:hypothetical protein
VSAGGRPDPGDTLRIEGYSAEVLETLADLLDRSVSREDQINREAELDDLWRQVDAALEATRHDERGPEEVARLEQLRRRVVEAHDLVGDRQPRAAAECLRRACVT